MIYNVEFSIHHFRIMLIIILKYEIPAVEVILMWTLE
jgi:hypothetical protein